MNPDAIEALSVFGGGALIAWAAAFAWAKWLKHRYDEYRVNAPASSIEAERITRIEQAVETLAVELERIGEGQRYTVKLLEDRLPQRLQTGRSGEPGRIVTPH
jgi:hypothetical protein